MVSRLIVRGDPQIVGASAAAMVYRFEKLALRVHRMQTDERVESAVTYDLHSNQETLEPIGGTGQAEQR